MMQRRGFLSWLVVSPLASALPAAAQQSDRIWRVGVLDWSSANDRVIYDGLIQALRELGYAEGRNITIEYRGADGDPERAARFAAELARSQVDIIVAISTPAAHAAKEATRTIPIVFHMADPRATGLVTSLARPGGNMTGVSIAIPDVAAKWLELLREIMPGVVRVAFLGSMPDPNSRTQLREVEASAARLGIVVRALLVGHAGEFEAAFAAAAEAHVSAVIVQTILLNHRAAIGGLAQRHRLPWTGERKDAAEAGALLAYGANRPAVYRRFAAIVDRVLKGANPGELPVEQPTKFELVINLKAAKALGLAVPPTLLARADEVIE
ncbi:MAG: ABC transporter substrate-binding protein [Deltaproteobacteria bacterium]|nr:ABC transporter substrate-binding protein [Deltaproteobacteria bacterium]